MLQRVKYALDRSLELLHPNDPWISPAAVQFCNANLNRSQVGLEWGSGRSTRWFAQRLKRLLSIEYNKEWHAKVTAAISDLPNVECRYIPLDHPLDEPCRADYDPIPKYVGVVEAFCDNSLDFVVVDGHYRPICIRHALRKIKPDGLLLVDDAGWLQLTDWGVPPAWPVVHNSHNSYKSTTVWQKPSLSGHRPI